MLLYVFKILILVFKQDINQYIAIHKLNNNFINIQVEGDESDELRCVFSSDIRYLDYSDGAESRLSSPYEIQYPLRMYKIFEKGKIHLVINYFFYFILFSNEIFIII